MAAIATTVLQETKPGDWTACGLLPDQCLKQIANNCSCDYFKRSTTQIVINKLVQKSGVR